MALKVSAMFPQRQRCGLIEATNCGGRGWIVGCFRSGNAAASLKLEVVTELDIRHPRFRSGNAAASLKPGLDDERPDDRHGFRSGNAAASLKPDKRVTIMAIEFPVSAAATLRPH